MQSARRWSVVVGLAIAATGLVLAGLTVVHLLEEHRDPLTLLLGGGIPIVAELATALGGLVIARSGFSKREAQWVLFWWVAGVAVAALMGGATVLYEHSHGVRLIDTQYVVTNNVSAGAAGGLLVGYFYARTLRRTEQLAEEHERLEVLNRVVRHDIRNDMNVVLGWLYTLEDHVDEDGRDALGRVESASEHVVELTEISREYVEIVVGDAEFELRPVPLDEVLRNEVETRRENYPDAEISLQGALPQVEVEANPMLGSVFRNLLNNAVQHNDEAVPVVDVGVDVGDDAVLVRIADNGPGVPDDRKEAIFGKGEQGLDSPGTGIGLYLVQSIVEEYGGDVWIEDNEPKGAVFTVRLQRA
ncbi:MAG: ATP-binding protein [Haloferacaceae archaeon]